MTVVCFGEILIDYLVAPTGDDEDLPGGAVAVALARLGLATAFVGAVGEDEPGQQLTHLLIEVGVNCDGLQPRPGPTRIVEVHAHSRPIAPLAGLSVARRLNLPIVHVIASTLLTSLPNRVVTQLATLQLGAIAAQPRPDELLAFWHNQTGQVWDLGTV
ncbi:MAG: PfkB family carbohydrate kinase [Cyanobacteria bacterium P01_E01_bin.43]